ncbi:cysteine-rich CWC family protein [Thiocapsa sp.]|uniref:cysteine-rich CWC family protein n=1 Tax=Thiocapsa sp. TaxID=2024551 RepID=UPI0039C9E7F4
MRTREGDDKIAPLPVQDVTVGLFEEHAGPRSRGQWDGRPATGRRTREAIASDCGAAIAACHVSSGGLSSIRLRRVPTSGGNGMGKHESKTCPRCGAEFECKANRAERCGCLSVVLTTEALDYLGERYRDCLCVACLADINRLCADSVDASREHR